MNGQRGLAIAITALLLTVCVGYLFNAEQTTTTATVYEDQADMGAMFYENSSRSSGSEVFNAPVNVTGWTPSELINTVTTPNQYIISQGTVNYSADKTLSKTFNNSGKSYTTTSAVSGGTWYYKTNTTALYYGGSNLNNGESLHGGISYPSGGNLKLDYQLNGTSTTTGNYLLFMPIGDVWSYSDKDYIYLNNGTNYYYDCEYTASGAFFNGGITVNFTGTAIDGTWHHAIYNNSTMQWDVYNSNDGKIETVENFYIVGTDPAASFTIKYKSFSGSSNSVYADPTKLIDLSSSTFAYWNADNTTTQYTSITLLIKCPDLASGSSGISIYTRPTNTDPSAAVFKTVKNIGNDELLIGNQNHAFSSANAYAGYLLKLDFINNTYTATGILSFDDNAPRTNYTSSNVSMSDVIADADTTRDYVNYFFIGSYYNWNQTINGNWEIAIIETEIVTDPQGILWNDFNLDVSDYFPSQIADNNNLGVRVQLGGFVSYGDSLTINGQTFAVTDGTITVPLTDGLTVQNKTMKLSGLAIDYRKGGNAYLVFTESLNRECDLGAIANYDLSGAGAWYFSATFNTIEQTTANVWEWSQDWSLDTNATCLIFLGLSIFGLVLGLYLGRGTFGLYDWVVLILADIIALSLMVV